MIDLTPLDVRKKAADFRRVMRGYDPEEVQSFLQLTAERMEELVKENLTLKERSERLQQQVKAHEGRESAVQEALVMAQKLREDLRAQSEREAELARQQAEAEIERRAAEAERRLDGARRTLAALEQRRLRFLKGFRSLLQRELEAVEVEEGRGSGAVEDDRSAAREAEDAPAAAAGSNDPAEAAEPNDPAEAAADAPDGQDPLWLSSILQQADARRRGREEEPPI